MSDGEYRGFIGEALIAADMVSGNDTTALNRAIDKAGNDYAAYMDAYMEWEKDMSGSEPKDPFAENEDVRDVVRAAFDITLPAGVQTIMDVSGGDVFSYSSSPAVTRAIKSAASKNTVNSKNRENVRKITMKSIEKLDEGAFKDCSSQYSSEYSGLTFTL